MTDVTNTYARVFRAWLDAPDPALESDVRALIDLDETEWKRIQLAEPSLFSPSVTRTLITLAHEALGRNPNRSVWLARLATRVARDAWGPESELDLMIAAEGDAWREYAAALLETAHYTDADFAVKFAREIYDLSAFTDYNKAILGIIEGRVQHELGYSQRGIDVIERNANLLLHWHEDKKAYVAARIAHAAILFNLEQYSTAATMLDRVTTIAQEQADSETLAYIVNMVGRCSVKLGDFQSAEACFKAALEMFESAGLYAEMPRVRKGIVDILVAKDRYNEAISELYMARAEFLAMALPVIAALVSLDIVDLLLIQGRRSEVELLCEDMVTTFTSARLPGNALKALQHLQNLAERSAVTEDDVQRVRAYLELLPSDPDRLFTA
ncbi:MAG TPA: tetratricopeptide repeat protein [Thermoanaerobaculia bacterium]|nr:tetratricopeptide repeat protein [Thermoanaerobaculia bacterium]